jgi:hypothetical protein
MNRTNRSIAALFILTALAVQPVATHAMAGRVAQAAKQGFNAAKQFASRHDLGDKAKAAAPFMFMGYCVFNPVGASSLDYETGVYKPQPNQDSLNFRFLTAHTGILLGGLNIALHFAFRGMIPRHFAKQSQQTSNRDNWLLAKLLAVPTLGMSFLTAQDPIGLSYYAQKPNFSGCSTSEKLWHHFRQAHDYPAYPVLKILHTLDSRK